MWGADKRTQVKRGHAGAVQRQQVAPRFNLHIAHEWLVSMARCAVPALAYHFSGQQRLAQLEGGMQTRIRAPSPVAVRGRRRACRGARRGAIQLRQAPSARPVVCRGTQAQQVHAKLLQAQLHAQRQRAVLVSMVHQPQHRACTRAESVAVCAAERPLPSFTHPAGPQPALRALNPRT